MRQVISHYKVSQGMSVMTSGVLLACVDINVGDAGLTLDMAAPDELAMAPLDVPHHLQAYI